MKRGSAASDDERWLTWSRGLELPPHPSPDAVETYLLNLARALEARPAPLHRLRRTTRVALERKLALHYDQIAAELEREAGAFGNSLLSGPVAAAGSVAGYLGLEGRIIGAGARALAGSAQRRHAARLRKLEALAVEVRRLLMLLRWSLVEES